MTAHVHYFEPRRKCIHGRPMKEVHRFSAPPEWVHGDCHECEAEDMARQDREDAEADAFCERVKARQERK